VIPTPLRVCPTPHKIGYATRGAALAGFTVGPETPVITTQILAHHQ